MPRPGKFSTKVITRGVDPQLSCTYKSARLKQYFKDYAERLVMPRDWLG